MGLLGLLDRAPAPTAAPMAALVGDRLNAARLFGRQLDQTCGYVDGDSVFPVYCPSAYECVANSLDNARGCCLPPIAQCTLATACIDNADLPLSCDILCSANNYQMKCTDVIKPYCFTRYWVTNTPDGTQLEFGCTDTSDLMQTAYTNFMGDEVSINANGSYFSTSFSMSALPPLTIGVLPTGGGSGGAAASGGVGATVGGSVSSASPTSTGSAGSNAGVSGSGSTGGGLSQGATIAIAVCATIVGLALIGLAVFMIWWRKKKQDQRANAAGDRQNMRYAPPPEHPPFDQGPEGTGPGDYYSPSAVGGAGYPKGEPHWSAVDDDRLGQMRRFSDEGTVATFDQTVAGRTNDDFRPQGA